MTTVAPRMMVPAFLRNPFVLSQVCNKTPFTEGTLYVGSSITKGADIPLNMVLLSIPATIKATTIPNRYIDNNIKPWFAVKNAPMNIE